MDGSGHCRAARYLPCFAKMAAARAVHASQMSVQLSGPTKTRSADCGLRQNEQHFGSGEMAHSQARLCLLGIFS